MKSIPYRPTLALLALVAMFTFFHSSTAFSQNDVSSTETSQEVAPSATVADTTATSSDTTATSSDTTATSSDVPSNDSVPTNSEEVTKTTLSLWSAITSKNWTLVFSFGVMLAVFVVRKTGVLDQVSTKILPWISIALGVLVAVAAALINGQDLSTAIIAGIGIGLSGSGLWSSVGKWLDKSNTTTTQG